MKRLFSFILLLCSALFLFALSTGHTGDPSFNVVTDRSAEHVFGWYGSAFVDVIAQSIGLFAGTILLICLCSFALLFLLRKRWQGMFLLLSFLFVPAFSFVGMSLLGEDNTLVQILVLFGLDNKEKSVGIALFLFLFIVLFYASGLFPRRRRARKKIDTIKAPKTKMFSSVKSPIISSEKKRIPQQGHPQHHSKEQLRANVMAVSQKSRNVQSPAHSPKPLPTPKPFPAQDFSPQEDKTKIETPRVRESLTSPDDQLAQRPAIPKLFEKQNAYTPHTEELKDPESQALIEDTLKEFGSPGEVIAASQGPFVTLYEVRPERGVKASKIIALAEELALSLRKSGVRLSVIPEKNVVGVEVPNKDNTIVPFDYLINSTLFKKTKMALPIALGVDIAGEPRLMDLAKAPHLLVAGTTGSGKSIGLHALIVSLLVHHPWRKCRFIMVDPKVLELSVYNDIPHLLAPVINDTQKAISVLEWLIGEMDNRYHAIARAGARNIESYNELSKTMKHSPFPFIVVIIDEMADLMITAGKELEAKIQRLAQMARAAGIHLVMATQRPSVDVITGVIKANFPARIAFRVNSRIDSRTILGGEGGAEVLMGKGDMLAMFSDGHIQRLHGAFITEEAVARIVQWAKKQAPPQYVEGILRQEEHTKAKEQENNIDELYDQALALVKSDQKISISYLQRKMQIGYNRSARLVDIMEERGVVSAPDKMGKRSIL